jgi:hypothetical protein
MWRVVVSEEDVDICISEDLECDVRVKLLEVGKNKSRKSVGFRRGCAPYEYAIPRYHDPFSKRRKSVQVYVSLPLRLEIVVSTR